MGNPTREDIDKHRDDIENAFVGFATAMIAIQSMGGEPSENMLMYGRSLMNMMEEVATMYSLVDHPAGTFVMNVAEVERFILMNFDQRMVNAGEMRGFLHIGVGKPVACNMREAHSQCEMLGIEFSVLDPLEMAVSDSMFDKIIQGASKIVGEQFDVKAWFNKNIMGG